MKLFVYTMCAFLAVANAGFLGLLKGGNAGASHVQLYGGHSHYGHSHGYAHSSPPQIINVKVIHDHPSTPISGPVPALKVIKVIHQESARGFGGYGPSVAEQAPEVIKVIHENAVSNSGSHIGGPAKVIRVIHEQAPAPTVLTGSASVLAPQTSVLPPVQSPPIAFNVPAKQYGAPAFQQTAPVPQYSAPEPIPIATHVPAQSYGPPH